MRDLQRPAQSLPRLGLSHAALQAAIQAQLEESGYGEEAGPIGDAVAAAIDNNNHEILRQLRQLLSAEPSDAATSSGAEDDQAGA